MSNFIQRISRVEVQDFIKKNLNVDIQKLILKGSPFADISIQEIAIQIDGKKKVEKKLPTWFKTEGIIFPSKLNLEQASSEITATYKANLITKGNLIDLTGGFGVDDFAFAKNAKKVIHCEVNEELSTIVSNNFTHLGVANIEFKIGDSYKVLQQIKKVDTIYIDPSRRVNTIRVFLLKDCEPNVVERQGLYLSKADKIIIKTAPMLDISSALQVLKQVSEVHVISVNNECKEILFVLEKKMKPEPEIFCALLNNHHQIIYPFRYSEEKALQIKAKPLKNYLYEPDAAILKAGFFKSLTQQFKIDKIHQHTHLYTSEILVENFAGKTFKIIKTTPFQNFKTSKTTAKANVVTRNFNLKPEEIKKQFKIKDGGNLYLFFCTDCKEQKVVLEVERIYKNNS
jgi:precorrin-6B methylase 2